MATIMIVDDNAFFREVIAHVLEPHYLITTFANGLEAIEWLQAGARPSLVITDLDMPVIDGYGLLAYLRAHYPALPIPVMVISADVASTTRIDCLQRGADQFLTKPINPQEVKAHVSILLRTRSLQIGLPVNLHTTAPAFL